MHFITRKDYKDLITSYHNAREMFAIVGKRGVGKSEYCRSLMKKFRDENYIVFDLVAGIDSSTSELLNYTKERLNYQLADFTNLAITENKSWHHLFWQFSTILKSFGEQKIFLFIDEFAWFQKAKSQFLDAFSEFYESLAHHNITIVLASSAIGWVRKSVLKNKGLLHNRVKRIFITPFNLLETKEFLLRNKNSEMTNFEIVQYYFMTGGVARLLMQIDGNKSIKDNAEALYLNYRLGRKNEFQELFLTTFQFSHSLHQKLIELYQDYHYLNVQQIKEKLAVSETTARKLVKELVENNLLAETIKYGTKDKQCYYELSDLFCYYFLRIKKYGVNQIENLAFQGFAFEQLIKQNIHLFYPTGKHYSFENDKAQIDLVIENQRYFELLEIKFYDGHLNIDQNMILNWRNKRREFIEYLDRVRRWRKVEVGFTLFSMWGASQNHSFPYQQIILSDWLDKHKI